MPFDFRATQVQTKKLIPSGSVSSTPGTSQIAIYPIEAASSSMNDGVPNAALQSVFDDNTDMFMFVSGAIGSAGTSTRGASVFGGDLVVSGNLHVAGTSPGGSGQSYLVSSSITVTSDMNNGVLVVLMTTASVVLTFPSTLEEQFKVKVLRSSTGSDPGPQYTISFVGSGATHIFAPVDTVKSYLECVEVHKVLITGGIHVYSTKFGFIPPTSSGIAPGAPMLFADASGRRFSPPAAPTVHQGSALISLAQYDQGHVIADMATIAGDLTVSITSSLRPGYQTMLYKSGSNDEIVFGSGGGYITPEIYGATNITADGSVVVITVLSSTRATVRVYEPGDIVRPGELLSYEVAAGVTSAVSASVLTLDDSTHRNQHTPLDTSSNGILVRIPDDLNPGFSWTGRKSSASNAVTFHTGGGFITPTFYGQNTCTVANTVVTVFVEDSSTAMVTIVESV